MDEHSKGADQAVAGNVEAAVEERGLGREDRGDRLELGEILLDAEHCGLVEGG